MEECIGNICYRLLTSEYLDDALKVMRKSFYQYESASVATGVAQCEGAMTELDELSKWAARDGISFIAVDRNTSTVVGVIFNKLQVNTDPFFDNFAKSCKYKQSQGLVQFMIQADSACDLFEHCKVDCVLEMMFLATLPEYGKRGIGLKLCEMSVEIGKQLFSGINAKQPLNCKVLPLEPVPKLISALMTSPYSQKIGKKLGLEIAARISYDNFFYCGKSFSSVLGSQIPDTTLEFKRLDE